MFIHIIMPNDEGGCSMGCVARVVGAGPCGLVVAYRLLQSGGFERVEIYEAQGQVGGCWNVERMSGLKGICYGIVEHSPRVILSFYRTFYALLQEIGGDKSKIKEMMDLKEDRVRFIWKNLSMRDYFVLSKHLVAKPWSKPVYEFAEGLSPGGKRVLSTFAAIMEQSWKRTPMRTLMRIINYAPELPRTYQYTASFDEYFPIAKRIEEMGGIIHLNMPMHIEGSKLVNEKTGALLTIDDRNPVIMATNGAHDTIAEKRNTTISRGVQYHFDRDFVWVHHYDTIFDADSDAAVVALKTAVTNVHTLSCVLLNPEEFTFSSEQEFVDFVYYQLRKRSNTLPKNYGSYTVTPVQRPWLITDSHIDTLPLVRPHQPDVYWPSFLNPGVPCPVNVLEGALQAGELCARDILNKVVHPKLVQKTNIKKPASMVQIMFMFAIFVVGMRIMCIQSASLKVEQYARKIVCVCCASQSAPASSVRTRIAARGGDALRIS